MSDGLLVKFLSLNNPQLNVQFDFIDNGNDIAAFMFKCFAQDPIQSSRDFLGVTDCTVLQGPSSVSDVPNRSDQAVLMTVETAPATIAVQSKRLRLVLEGIITWEWDVVFDFPVFPFRLDGTWTQVR